MEDKIFGDVIHQYTRAEAIEDGVLIDVSETAREAGIKYPVAITAAAYERIEPNERERELCQDFAGRLWDLLWMFRSYAQRHTGGPEMMFKVILVTRGRFINQQRPKVEFKAVVSPGDDMEPVITIMMPNED